MANTSDWAAEKNTPAQKMTAEDRHSILVFLGGAAGAVVALLLIGRYLHYLY